MKTVKLTSPYNEWTPNSNFNNGFTPALKHRSKTNKRFRSTKNRFNNTVVHETVVTTPSNISTGSHNDHAPTVSGQSNYKLLNDDQQLEYDIKPDFDGLCLIHNEITPLTIDTITILNNIPLARHSTLSTTYLKPKVLVIIKKFTLQIAISNDFETKNRENAFADSLCLVFDLPAQVVNTRNDDVHLNLQYLSEKNDIEIQIDYIFDESSTTDISDDYFDIHGEYPDKVLNLSHFAGPSNPISSATIAQQLAHQRFFSSRSLFDFQYYQAMCHPSM
jgi:hypothetical protein